MVEQGYEPHSFEHKVCAISILAYCLPKINLKNMFITQMLPLTCTLADTLTQLVGNQLSLPSFDFCMTWGRNTSTLRSHTSHFGTDPTLILLEVLTWSINSRRPDAQQPGLHCTLLSYKSTKLPKISNVEICFQKWRLISWIIVWLGWGLNCNNHGKKPCPTSTELKGWNKFTYSFIDFFIQWLSIEYLLNARNCMY